MAIVDYPGCMRSAVLGLQELFSLANMVAEQEDIPQRFSIDIISMDDIKQGTMAVDSLKVMILPPSLGGGYYLEPEQELLDWILKHHAKGSTLCSACAGAFIIAASGLSEGRRCTTHWDLSHEFEERYPNVPLDSNKILINDGDLITAGGLMSWVDLGLELVAQLTSPILMRKLGKLMVVDTGPREQRYYNSLSPRLDHGDEDILKIQHYMQANFHHALTVKALAERAHLGERTFLRRFLKATGHRPSEYLQRLRIRKACELIESTNTSIDNIAYQVGYEDSSAFRKTFIKIIGLTPRDFKKRFCA